ncbi:MAG: MBL fold metallo-hydrolase [Actinomycetota bacterium]
MELTVLGASGTWPSAGTATSGYLVRHDGFNLWVDAGTGTLANLQRHIRISDIDGILISHAHPDHYVDLYPCFYARHYGELGEPGLPLFVPTDFTRLLAEPVSVDGRALLRTAFAFREVAPGEAFEVGPFRVKTEPMSHVGLPALGFRLETDGAVLAYTGDTGPTDHVDRLARDSDVLLSEATWQDGDDLKPFHLSSRQAAIHARNAEVGRLVLTHVWPTLDKQVSIEQAAEEYAGPIEAAVEGMRLEVRG